MGNALESVGGVLHEEVLFLCRGYAKLSMAMAIVVGGYERRKNEKKGKRERERERETDGKGKERARQAGQWPRSEQRGAACTGGSSRFVDLGRNARHNLP